MIQLPLPAIPASAPRVRTRHRYGLPSGQYAEAVCKRCPVHRRYGPFGAKQGYQHQWSKDGEDWVDNELACVTKGSR
jgi:hypothetical protein